ncbi:DUF3604 domain-containing protein [Tropicimonas sp. TH_r6]|uniref:DUF3604 domain-containing protein n=1 Tax=Tropicimonas sp. TH_r6 TaxID=3082085 RepID=UPI002955B5C8|nr:DUF3604 domain-containing protein [Tropicimonas sp. TH_r6]MDV7144636.1 DUF3604 domain-containing protein [Tropicimonas sp. TH_r6]
MLKRLLSATALLGAANLAAADPNPLRDAYFGETHLHTAFSLDAYIGGTRLMPADSLAYARGEPVTLPDGTTAQHTRPLDFAAVTDHAEYMGEMYSTMFEDAPGHDNADLVALRGLESLEDRQQWFIKYVVSSNRSATPQHPPFFAGPATAKSAWQVIVDAAEEANDPGTFTALIGFEWSAAPNGANLHRNVLFRDSNVPASVPSYIDINAEENLWAWMKDQETEGRRLLAIPHNSNASKGRMFPDTDSFGEAMDLDYARTRQAYEPLIEMMQVKGNSEVHRKFWSADEFAGFENADSIQKNSGRVFRQRDFVRGGLIDGLGYEFALGVNPFKYGFIGGTDNHNGMMSAVAEDSFIGAHGPEDGSVERRRSGSVAGWIDGQDLSIGSLAGVWATQNTRGAIWDAMKRRETFATSGPRIKVRMFGGVGFSEPTDPVAMAEEGYLLGTHMGGNLPPLGAAPSFTVHAEKDPMGANLDRIQIIKGWVDEYGDANEKIIDVVWSGSREIDPATGKLPPVGNTVDLETAMFTNEIGAPVLMGRWTDAEYDPQAIAFYYARAIEIPTPRWTTYDAVRNGLPLLEDVPAVIQERAWGSPIFYSPTN